MFLIADYSLTIEKFDLKLFWKNSFKTRRLGMNFRLACAAISWALAIVAAPTASAQMLHSDIEKLAQEVADEAARASEEAAKPENVEQRRKYDRIMADNAMRQIAISHDRSIAEKLPLPDYVGLDAIQAALAHENAWEASSEEGHHINRALIDALVGLSFDAGHLMWAEWACNSSRMQEVAAQYIDIVDSLVTAYPERLMLKSALTSRDTIGYPHDKKCDLQFLELSRLRYQENLSAILALSASAAD